MPLLDGVTLGDRMDFDPEIVVRLAWTASRSSTSRLGSRYFRGGLSHFRMIRDNLLIVRTYLRLVGARVLPRARVARHGDGGGRSAHRLLDVRRERGSILGMRFVVWCYRLLGRRFCQWLILPWSCTSS